MNCPVCGSDTKSIEGFPWHFCNDVDCVCHKYALLEETDEEGIVFLKETMVTKEDLNKRIKKLLDILY